MISKQILNYYNTNLSLETTSKLIKNVQKCSQKYTFTHKLTTKLNFQTHLNFSSQPSWKRTGLWDIKESEGYIYGAFGNRSIMREEVRLTLDSDVPWCLPTSEGSIFQISDAAELLKKKINIFIFFA